MDLLNRFTSLLATKLAEWEIRHQLAALDDRSLADIGLERAGIVRFAHAAAQPDVPRGRSDSRSGSAVVLTGHALGLRAV